MKYVQNIIHEGHQGTLSYFFFLRVLRVAKGVQSFRGFCFPCSLVPVWARSC